MQSQMKNNNHMKKILTLCAAAMIAISMMATEGALNGKFSVSATKKVYFSKGNLQYQASTDKWRFAEKQWHFVGGSSTGVVYENDEKCSNKLISDTYTGWIDLFGWGTGNNPTLATEDDGDYSTFTDWGINKISNGGNADSLWRTLTSDEWIYLIHERPNADSLFTYATINSKVGAEDVSVVGLILLPDNWVAPAGVTVNRLLAAGNDVTWTTSSSSEYYEIKVSNPFSINSYSDSQWQTLEEAGAVFLPWTSYRSAEKMWEADIAGAYWCPTPRPGYPEDAYVLQFRRNELLPEQSSRLHYGHAVRLVQECVKDPNVFTDGILPGRFSVTAGKQIRFSQGNLQYRGTKDEFKFAEMQYDFVGAANLNIAETYDGYIDLFGWGTSGNNGREPWLNTNNDLDYGNPDNNTKSDIARTFYDWGLYRTIKNGGTLGLVWRTPTAAEWKYIFAQRDNAAALRSKATVAGVEGLILLPDDWDLMAKPLAATLSNFTDVTLSADTWLAWELAGAVFLPQAGTRNPNLGTYSATSCTYATGTYSDYYGDYRMCSTFNLDYATTQDGIGSTDYMMGTSVRLVRDCSGTTGIEETITPAPSNRKFIKDGQLLILRDGKTFNALGIEVK